MFRKYQISLPMDSPERTMFHRQLIRRKKFLRKLYEQWYAGFLRETDSLPPGKFIELGAGGGFFKELEPRIIASDILELPTNDLTFSALDMPFDSNSVSAIFMVDTLHHIPDMQKFFDEANRVLKPGGKIIMLEPANSRWGRFIFTRFHHEPFDPAGGWTIPETGPLSGANGALPWIVTQRDRKKFQKLYPELNIVSIKYCNPILYLAGGGLTYPQLFPGFLYPIVAFVDWLLPKISCEISMFQRIIIEKSEAVCLPGTSIVDKCSPKTRNSYSDGADAE